MRKFVVPGSCSLEDTVYLPPCPLDWFAQNGSCLECPSLSLTLSDGAVGVVSGLVIVGVGWF